MNQYKTTDLALAGALSCRGHKVTQSIKAPNGRVTFYFKEVNTLKKDIEAYWQQEMHVEPSHYFTSIKQLKNMIYNQSI